MRMHTSPSHRLARIALGGVLGCLAVGLIGCQSLPVASLPALSRIDPFTLDPRELRAALVHDQDVVLSPDGAVLTLTLSEVDGPTLAREVFRLVPGAADADLAVPSRMVGTVYGIEDKDAARFDAFSAKLRERRETAPGRNSFTINVNLRPCTSTVGERPSALISAYVKTARTQRFVAVARDLSLKALTAEALAPCAVDRAPADAARALLKPSI